ARYFYEEIDQRLRGHDVELAQVTVWENPYSGATYRP
ncbi:MAG: 6-carboxytetrahydropterin synthase, partial [Deltaproteobacteria bacterium]|nr:6-carboxytetrahydropterin synthase [Deltaproteobacteria bacterium]